MSPDDLEPLQPLDPKNDPLVSQASDEPAQKNVPNESDTFEIIEPTPAPQQNQPSEFADPLMADPEPLADELGSLEQESEPLPDFVPSSQPDHHPASPEIKFKHKDSKAPFGEPDSNETTQNEEQSAVPNKPKGIKEFCLLTCRNGEQVACKMRSLFRLPEPKPESSSWQSRIMDLIRPVIHCLFGLLYWVYSYLQTIFKFYLDHRKGLWFYLLDLLKHVPPTDVYQREIRLREKDAEELKMLKNEVWKIPLPSRCIQCGRTNNCRQHQSSERVENYRFVFMGFLAGLLTSIFFSIMTWSSLLFLISPVIGLTSGYLLRKSIRVKIEYFTCDEHHNQTDFPKLRFFGEEIFILVGNRNLRQDFIKELEEAGISRKG